MKKPTVRVANKWLKVTVSFPQSVDLATSALELVMRFEERLAVPHLYFSRYVDLVRNDIEVSCWTSATARRIKSFFRVNKAINVKIENRGSGSLAHVMGYKAVSYMGQKQRDDSNGWKQLLDVVHWMCNMSGYDYAREIRFYNYAGYCFADQLATASDLATAKLKGGKAPASSAAKASSDDHQSKPAVSSRAAFHKAHG